MSTYIESILFMQKIGSLEAENNSLKTEVSPPLPIENSVA